MQTACTVNQHWQNGNLTLHYEPTYLGLPVLARQDQPLVVQYLDAILDTMEGALFHHRRVTVFLFELKMPTIYPVGLTDNSVITRFWKSLKAQIQANRSRARRELAEPHDTGVFYVWVREYNASETAPHWHCALLVNQDAYFTMGWIQSNQENMYHRIASAWASALGVHVSQIPGLVHLPENSTYHIDQNKSGDERRKCFQRLSYYAKAPTKVFHDGIHAFGCSRTRRRSASSRWQ